MKRLPTIFALLLALAVSYILFWPVPIDPVAWHAPASEGLTGVYAPNQRLEGLERLSLGDAWGPEDAVTGPDGRIFASVRDGRIVIVDPVSGEVAEFANTDGKPLGIEFGPDGTLYVADAYRGLLAIDVSGGVTTLADTDADGRRLVYVDDLDVAQDGTVYFSDASSKFGAEASGGTFPASLLDLMEHGGHGRVLRYTPGAGSTETLVEGLNFANGIALAADESFVLVSETGSYRILRVWLQGRRAGELEAVLSNLPGFPDNLNRADDGSFWLGLISPRSPVLDGISGKPTLRRIVQRLPRQLRPKAQHYGFVLRFDADGRVLETLQAPDGSYAMTTGAADGPNGSTLVTSLTENALGLLR